jgi:hypothetical protein
MRRDMVILSTSLPRAESHREIGWSIRARCVRPLRRLAQKIHDTESEEVQHDNRPDCEVIDAG